MEAKLSSNVKKVIVNSRDEALRLSSDSVGIEHIFLGMLREKDCSAVQLLNGMNVDLPAMKIKIEDTVRNTLSFQISTYHILVFNQYGKQKMNSSYFAALVLCTLQKRYFNHFLGLA